MKKKTWQLKEELLRKIKKAGGFVNCHAHLDRAFTINKKNFHLANADLKEKWYLVDALKRKSTVSQIYSRMAQGVENMLPQGVQAIGTFIDIDEVIKDKAIKAAQKLKTKYKKNIKIKFINQTLKGVINKQARKWFEIGSQFVDIIGGLPSKDKGKEKEHLDILLDTAKKMKKMVHVHVDQLNTRKEKETAMLIKKVKEHKMEGKVVAIHGISIGAQLKNYRQKLYHKMKQVKLMMIACPTAWIDSRRCEELTPTHNAITPVDEMIPQRITVGLGTDNIADIYKPFSDGNMWIELRFLLEACHFYQINQLAKIASSNGLKILGIK